MADIGKMALQIQLSPGTFDRDMQRSAQNVASFSKQANAQLSSIGGSLAMGDLSGAISGITSLVAGMGKYTLGMIAAGGALALVTSSSMKAMEQQAGLAKRFNITTEAAAGLQFIASKYGIDSETITTTLGLLTRKIGQMKDELAGGHGGPLTRALQQMGIDAERFIGLPVDEQLSQVSQGLLDLKVPAERAAAAFHFFGKSFDSLAPMLLRGAANLAKARQEAILLGLSVGGINALAVKDALQSMEHAAAYLKSIAQSIGMAIGVGIAPALQAMGDAIKDMVLGMQPGLQIVRDLFRGVADAISFVVTTVIDGLTPVVTSIGAILGMIGSAWAAVKSFFLGIDAGAAIDQIKGLLTVLVTVIGWFGVGTAAIWLFHKAMVAKAAILAIARAALIWMAGGTAAQAAATGALTGVTVTATAAMVTFRAAMAATGIGLLVIGMGFLVDRLMNVPPAARAAAAEIGRLQELARNTTTPANVVDAANPLIAARQRLAELEGLNRIGRGDAANLVTVQQITALREQITGLEGVLAAQELINTAVGLYNTFMSSIAEQTRRRAIDEARAAATAAVGDEARLAAALRLQAALNAPAPPTSQNAIGASAAVTELTKALEDQIAVAGLNAAQLEQRKLALAGATQAQRDNIAALQDQRTLMQDLAAQIANVESTWAKQIRDNTLAMRTQAQIAEQLRTGIDPSAQLAREQAINAAVQLGNRELAHKLQLANEYMVIQQQQLNLQRQAAATHAAVQSPLERFQAAQEQLGAQRDQNLITPEQFDLRLLQLFNEFAGAAEKSIAQGSAVAQEGSAAAVSAVNRAIIAANTRRDDPNRRVLDALERARLQRERQVQDGAAIRRALENVNVAVIPG